MSGYTMQELSINRGFTFPRAEMPPVLGIDQVPEEPPTFNDDCETVITALKRVWQRAHEATARDEEGNLQHPIEASEAELMCQGLAKLRDTLHGSSAQASGLYEDLAEQAFTPTVPENAAGLEQQLVGTTS